MLAKSCASMARSYKNQVHLTGKLKLVWEVCTAPHPQPFLRLRGKGACPFNVRTPVPQNMDKEM